MMSALESCRWIRTQLPRFLDCELPSDLAAHVSVHLERCGGCRDALAAERDALIDTISALVPAEPPPGMLDLVMAEIAEAPSTSLQPLLLAERPRARFPSFAPALAAAALLGFVLWAIPGENEVSRSSSGSPLAKVDGDPGRAGDLAQFEAELIPGAPNGIATEVASSDTAPPQESPSSGGPFGEVKLVLGDVDSNGRFDQHDVNQLNRYVGTGTDLACLAAGDFDDDGAVTLNDSSLAVAMSFTGADATGTQRLFVLKADDSLTCAYLSCP